MASLNFEQSLKFFGLATLEKQNEETLHQIYKKQALIYHPDKGGRAEDFIKLRQAFALLKKHLNDPNQKKSAGTSSSNGDYKYESKTSYSYDYSGTTKTENDHLRDKIAGLESQIQDYSTKLNNYQIAYEKVLANNARYEDIFNLQIQVMSFTQEQINILVSEYKLKQEKIQYYYDAKLSELKSREQPGFWRSLAGQKMEYSEYVSYHNKLVEEHNSSVAEIDSNFSEAILHIYREGFERMMDLLEF